jgi:hypothetical protein
MVDTTRLRLPLLSAGQAQKELTHNEALLLLDAVSHACCEGGPTAVPPQSPESGRAYICHAAPSGAWTGHANALACWSESGWRFVAPFDGLQVIDRVTGCTWRYMSGQWTSGVVNASEVHVDGTKVLGSRSSAIAQPIGGATVDAEARNVLAQVLLALRSHGLIASSG